MPAKIFRGGVAYGGGGAASDSSVQAIRCGDDIYTPVEGTVNLPDFTTINDTTASDSTTYSSNKINAEYPISSTTTGINPSITDSADGLVQDVTVYGRSDVSKNLLDSDDMEQGAISSAERQTYDQNKTSSLTRIRVKNLLPIDATKTYTLSVNSLYDCVVQAYNENGLGYTIQGVTNVWGKAVTFTGIPNIAVAVRYANEADITPSDASGAQIQLERGSTPTPYEPYFSGIHGIGEDGEVNVVTCGKNLFGLSIDTVKNTIVDAVWENNTATKNGVSFTFNCDSNNYVTSVTINGTASEQILYFAIATFDNYSDTIFTSNVASTWDVNGFALDLYNYTTSTGYNISSLAGVAITAGHYVLQFAAKSGVVFNNLEYKLMNRFPTTAPDYEPYVSTSAAVTTGIALYAVGEVKDELDEKKGVVVKRCEKVVFDGSEDWSEYAQSAIDAYGNHSFFLRFSDVPKARYMASSQLPNQLCNILTIASQDAIYYGGTVNTIGVVGDSGNQSFVQIRQQSCSTVADLKTYLAANPVTVVYELAEPVELPLTSAELTQLRNLRTYNPTTNVTVTDAPTSTVDYLLNTDNGQAVADVQNELQEQIDEKADEADLESGLALKVDKVEGKGLSTNDYTNADKSAVDNSPISSTTTGINPTITDSADGLIQDAKVYGRSRVSKNLFTTEGATEGAYLSDNGNQAQNSDWAITDFIEISGDYITCSVITNQPGNLPAICFYDDNKRYISGTNYGNRTTLTLTIPNAAKYVRASYFVTDTSWIDTMRLVLASYPAPDGISGIGEDGELEITTANSDNTASTIAAVTTGIPLYSVGDVKDELDEKKGVVVKRCGVATLTGSAGEIYIHNSSWENAGCFSIDNALPGAKSITGYETIANMLSNIGETTTPAALAGDEVTVGIGYGASVTLYIAVSPSITTMADLKTYLASNPVTVVYELATPTTQELTAAEKSALRNLRTYASTTNVTITDSPTVDIGYLLNTANGQAVANAIDNAITGVLNTSY